MTVPGLGGQQQPPISAPAGQAQPIGVAPGVQPKSVVIIIGTGALLLAYSPTAAAGNLVASIAGTAGTDAYGNAYLAGVTSYGADGVAQLDAGALQIATDTTVISDGWAGSVDGSEGSGYMTLTSPRESGTDTAATAILASASAGGGQSQFTVLADQCTLNASGVDLPTAGPTLTTLPDDDNSGSTWVDGERAFMNDSWIGPINDNFAAIISFLQEIGVMSD